MKGAIRIIRSEEAKLTVVGLQNPKPGTYRIDPLEGSPAVTKMAEATDSPAAKATVSVFFAAAAPRESSPTTSFAVPRSA